MTLKTDVYSFGVVLLEIFSGCGAIKRYSDGASGYLALWAKPHLSSKKELHCVIDEKIRQNYRIEEAYEFANIILQCLDRNPKSRPSMTEVVIRLEQLQERTTNTPNDSLILWIGFFFFSQLIMQMSVRNISRYKKMSMSSVLTIPHVPVYLSFSSLSYSLKKYIYTQLLRIETLKCLSLYSSLSPRNVNHSFRNKVSSHNVVDA